MTGRTAILFGATGLVGSRLLEELVRSSRYTRVKIFVRRPAGIEHIKIVEKIVDVENVESYSDELRGDDLYISLGTTMRKAGSIARYEQLDRDMVLEIASQAMARGVSRVAVVSALGASASSRNYYNRIKGEMEEGIVAKGFGRTVIGRPSLLLGERDEFRILEAAGKGFARLLSFMMAGSLRKYRAIEAHDVAIALVALMGEQSEETFYSSLQLQLVANIEKEKSTAGNNE